MSDIHIIAKTALAVDTVYEYVEASATSPVTYQVDGDLASNTIPIVGFGATETLGAQTTLYDDDAETALALTATKPWKTFYSPARVAFTKGITDNAVGLMKLR